MTKTDRNGGRKKKKTDNYKNARGRRTRSTLVKLNIEKKPKQQMVEGGVRC